MTNQYVKGSWLLAWLLVSRSSSSSPFIHELRTMERHTSHGKLTTQACLYTIDELDLAQQICFRKLQFYLTNQSWSKATAMLPLSEAEWLNISQIFSAPNGRDWLFEFLVAEILSWVFILNLPKEIPNIEKIRITQNGRD